MDQLIAWVESFFRTVYNVPELIRMAGLLGLIVIVFAETGLMIGFFLPGDSLLITAGLFAAKGDLNIWTLNIALILAAIIGDATGYYIGHRTGKALYSRPNSLLLPARAPDQDARVLREARRQDDHHRALHADRADVRAGGGGRGGDDLPQLRDLQRRRRARCGCSA